MIPSSLRPNLVGRNVLAVGSTGSKYEGILRQDPLREGKNRTNAAGKPCKATLYRAGTYRIFSTDTITVQK